MCFFLFSSAEKANGGKTAQRPHQHQHRAAEITSGTRVPEAAAWLQAGEGWHLGDGCGLPEELAAAEAAAAACRHWPDGGQWRLLSLCEGGCQLLVPLRGSDPGPQTAAQPLPGPSGVQQEHPQPLQPLASLLSSSSGQLQQGGEPGQLCSVEALVGWRQLQLYKKRRDLCLWMSWTEMWWLTQVFLLLLWQEIPYCFHTCEEIGTDCQ